MGSSGCLATPQWLIGSQAGPQQMPATVWGRLLAFFGARQAEVEEARSRTPDAAPGLTSDLRLCGLPAKGTSRFEMQGLAVPWGQLPQGRPHTDLGWPSRIPSSCPGQSGCCMRQRPRPLLMVPPGPWTSVSQPCSASLAGQPPRPQPQAVSRTEGAMWGRSPCCTAQQVVAWAAGGSGVGPLCPSGGMGGPAKAFLK